MMRVLVVDDHPLVRAGISLLLGHQDDMEAVGEAGTAAEAIELAGRMAPDIVLLDVTLPGGSGLECLPQLLAAAPQARVLMLSMHEDPNYVRAALGAGASGYVLKDAAYEELVDAIRSVAAGHAYVAPSLGAKLAVQATHQEDDELSDREREVLALLAGGYTNQEIASRLFVSVRTVESHRAHILVKLRLSTRAELVNYALETGLLRSPPEP
jgi:DNA-binding NarL/FixJ family response regulator